MLLFKDCRDAKESQDGHLHQGSCSMACQRDMVVVLPRSCSASAGGKHSPPPESHWVPLLYTSSRLPYCIRTAPCHHRINVIPWYAGNKERVKYTDEVKCGDEGDIEQKRRTNEKKKNLPPATPSFWTNMNGQCPSQLETELSLRIQIGMKDCLSVCLSNVLF